jgi:asparagine synthase (glutamine-hydrolysing)
MTSDVSNKYKVGLTGIGGDEVFAGYGKHDFSYRYSQLLNLSDNMAWILRKLNVALDRNFISLICAKRYQKYIALKNYPMLPVLNDIDGFTDWTKKTYPAVQSFEKDMYNEELIGVMPNSRCISVDLGSMSSSVELRTPYLNKDLLDLLATYDYRSLIAFGQKRILRDILKRYLPNSLVDTPKRGFTVPSNWLIEKYRGNSITDALPLSIRNLTTQTGYSRNIDRIITRSIILTQFLE